MDQTITYWPRVLLRALVETFRWFGGWRLLVAPFLFLVGALIHLYRFGLADTIEQFDVALSFGFYPPILFASVLFVCKFVCSPPEMERRAQEDARQQQENLQQKIKQLQRTIYDREKRQAAIDRLWELRKKGVELRNKEVICSQYPMWKTECDAWIEEIYEEAGKISPNLRNWLTILDRVRPPPRLSYQPSGPHHENNLKNMSEVLARIQEFLEAEMLKRDIQHYEPV